MKMRQKIFEIGYKNRIVISKHDYAIAVYFQHGIIDFEIPNYHYYSIAIAIFRIHLGITYRKYYYE